MPKLFYSPASPYSGKVRMAAAYVGIAVESVTVETGPQPALLTDANPLGKIPVWITDDGQSIYDSRVITQYLNRLSGNKLFPRNAEKRLDAERLEALADGICDCLLAIVYERRARPEEIIHQPWIDKQWSKVTRSLRPGAQAWLDSFDQLSGRMSGLLADGSANHNAGPMTIFSGDGLSQAPHQEKLELAMT